MEEYLSARRGGASTSAPPPRVVSVWGLTAGGFIPSVGAEEGKAVSVRGPRSAKTPTVLKLRVRAFTDIT